MARKPQKSASKRKRQSAPKRKRLDLNEAFQRMLSRRSAYEACEDLDQDLRRNRRHLWCNGKLVGPGYFRAQGLFVQVEPSDEGRWLCTIGSRLPMEPLDYRWEVEEIDAPGRARRGRPPTHEWPLIAAKIVRECIEDGRVKARLSSQAELTRDVLGWCTTTFGKEPHYGEMSAMVGAILQAFRGN